MQQFRVTGMKNIIMHRSIRWRRRRGGIREASALRVMHERDDHRRFNCRCSAEWSPLDRSLVRLWLICISTILVVENNKEIGRWIDNTACSTKERSKGVREGDHGINNRYGRLERMTGSRLRSSAFLSDFISWRASAASTYHQQTY